MSNRPNVILDETRGHKHWNRPRVPGRKVRRAQMRAAGMFKTRRRYRGHGKGTSAARIYQTPVTRPLIPAFLNKLPTMERLFGGDR